MPRIEGARGRRRVPTENNLDPAWVEAVERAKIRIGPVIKMASHLPITPRTKCAVCRLGFITDRAAAHAVIAIPHERGEDYLHRSCVEELLQSSSLVDEWRFDEEFVAYRATLEERYSA